MFSRPRRFAPVLCVVLLAAACAGCKRAGGESSAGGKGRAAGGAGVKGEAAAVEVTLAPVRKREVWRTIEVTGTLYGEHEATIASKLSGRVGTVAADVGDAVPSGTVLARIEARDYELGLAEAEAARASALARLGMSQAPGPGFDPETLPQVRRARAEAANAAARLDRARRLFEQTPPLISEQDFADIRTAHAVAKETAETELLAAGTLIAEVRARETAVEIARQRVADAVVAAPFPVEQGERVSYRVAQRMVNAGEYVTPGQALFRLVAVDRVDFRAEVAERFAGQVRSGQRVRVRVEASAEAVVGEVTRVSPRIEPSSRTFMVEVRIDNRDGNLKPGAFARGEIELRREEGVTFVPAGSVVTFAGVSRVFSVENGQAKEHRVSTGVRNGDDIEIIGGLAADEVVVGGAAGLARGVAVRVSAARAP